VKFKEQFDRVFEHIRSAVVISDASGIDAAKHNPSMWRGFVTGIGFAINLMPLIMKGNAGVEAVFVRLEELAILNNDHNTADKVRAEKFRFLTNMEVGGERITGTATNKPFPFVLFGKGGPPEA